MKKSNNSKKHCIFCDKERPYNYRKLKWHGVRYGNGPSYWACHECDEEQDLSRYSGWLAGRRYEKIQQLKAIPPNP